VRATTRILGHSLFALALLGCTLVHAGDAQELFQRHCAECHSPDRLGRIGPALLPENLGRLTPEEAATTIAAGRPATQMPNVTAGLIWPPEMFMVIVTAIAKAKACANAIPPTPRMPRCEVLSTIAPQPTKTNRNVPRNSAARGRKVGRIASVSKVCEDITRVPERDSR